MIKRSELKEALKICASGCRSDGCVFSEIAGSNGGMEDRNCASYMAEAVLEMFFPKKQSMAKLPCVCGCKRRERWDGFRDRHGTVEFRCMRCGLIGYMGKNEAEAVEGWNQKVRERSDE